MATHEAAIREHMKSVRSMEENLDELRRRRKAVSAKADAAEKKLAKMNPEVVLYHVVISGATLMPRI